MPISNDGKGSTIPLSDKYSANDIEKKIENTQFKYQLLPNQQNEILEFSQKQ